MKRLDTRGLKTYLPKVMGVIAKEMELQAVDKYSRGLSNEGYAGGYQAALNDVLAMVVHGYPSDSRGWWERAMRGTK